MVIILKLITVLTNSFIFLTCGSIVESIRLIISTQLAKASIDSKLMIAFSVPMVCLIITVLLITFTDYLSNLSNS